MNDKKYKILLVDDDKFLLDMYSMKLTKAGHEVVAMPSGIDAIAKIKEGYNPEIVVLDIIMPNQDGLQTLKIIRDEKLAENATVVMLTNEGDSVKIDTANNLRVDGYIVKATTIPSEVVEEITKIAASKNNS